MSDNPCENFAKVKKKKRLKIANTINKLQFFYIFVRQANTGLEKVKLQCFVDESEKTCNKTFSPEIDDHFCKVCEKCEFFLTVSKY